jgi:hypothetical protein
MRKSIPVLVVLLMAMIGVFSHQKGIADEELELLATQRKAVIAQVEDARILAAQLPEVVRAVEDLDVESSAEHIQREPFVCPEVEPSRVWLPLVRDAVEMARGELEKVCAEGARLHPIVQKVKTYKAILAAAEDTKE